MSQTFWKSIGVGVVALAAVKVLAVYSHHLPVWLGSAARSLWTVITFDLDLPLLLIFLCILAATMQQLKIIRLEVELEEALTHEMESQDRLARVMHEDMERHAKVTYEELTVLSDLARVDVGLSVGELIYKTKLPMTRVNHALLKLEDRGFIRYYGETGERVICLTQRGNLYAVEHNLDRQ